MAIPQELISTLEANIQDLARARFLLSNERLKAMEELARATNALIRSAVAAAAANDEMTGAMYHIVNGNVPEAEEGPVLLNLSRTARRANLILPSVSLEKTKLREAVVALLPMLEDAELDGSLATVQAQVSALSSLLQAYINAEPEGE